MIKVKDNKTKKEGWIKSEVLFEGFVNSIFEQLEKEKREKI